MRYERKWACLILSSQYYYSEALSKIMKNSRIAGPQPGFKSGILRAFVRSNLVVKWSSSNSGELFQRALLTFWSLSLILA